MKYLKKFESYGNESINEGLFDFLKKMFTEMFDGLGEIYTQQTKKVFDDIQKQKEPSAVYGILKNFVTINKNNFNGELKKAKDLQTIRDSAYSTIVSLYAAFETGAKKLSDEKISFNNIFGENPPKEIRKIFNQKDTKQREKMILDFSNNLISGLSSGLKIDKAELDEVLKRGVGEVPQANNKEEQTSSDEKQKDEIKTGEPEQTTDNQNEPKVETQNASYNFINEKVDNKQLSSLKDLVQKWYNTSIYDKLEKNINTMLGTSKTDGGVDIMGSISKVTATEHKDSLQKMVNSIVNLNDKDKFVKIRDMLDKMGYIKKDDIGFF